MTTIEILLLSAVLCSSDVIAAVACIKVEDQPKLFSIVFGEGVTNDAVCIILFNTVMKYTSSPMTTWTPLLITADLIQLGLLSIVIGVVVSALGSYLLKRFRVLTENPVIETSFVFVFGYLAYACSEVTHHSGIIAVLTAGILLSHYSWYNLSP